ncbi:phytoene desaturase [Paenibacillus swuensis]|uniref:Phytoene desaturase n=1 Tax=Paenibacillus swuensis TaxID=1178515 RepID=A0A172TJK1_9BACL|nr:phytoene desaturase family protein [Paenibacillus swuensis]ANE47249.1 phytoene desaturase [Paenibacillus swuensis]
MRKRVAIVGAGPGGLASGMLLASAGYQVTVAEKQPHVGGRCSRLTLGDYSFDMGPTFLMMPDLLRELFQSVGRNLDDYITMMPVDPLYRLKFGETEFTPTMNRQETKERIEALFPGNGAGYERFLREEELKFNKVMPLLQQPFTRLSDYLKGNVFAALPKLHLMDTVHSRLSKYFTDERLITAFSFQAKYLGMSPWDCPGTFTILSYLEHAYGLFHPIGGVNRICHAMAEIIKEYGGEVMLDAGVEEIVVRNGKATGIRLENGKTVDADDVVINADFGTAVTQLFAPGVIRKYGTQSLAKKKWSCSTFMMYLGIDGEVDLPHHNIYFAGDYRTNVEDITRTKILSTDPSIYVHNPGRLDSTLAPAGKTALYVLLPTPNLTGPVEWDQVKNKLREQVLLRLEQEPELRGLSSRIEVEKIITPQQWQDDVHVYKGATFNLAHTLDQMMYLRPHNRFEEVDRCWLVGGGTHPGSGLPTILESAKISSGMLMERDLKSGYRATTAVPGMAKGGRIG